MLGALIDLKIRHETDNNKSLNDVMRFFNRWFAEQNVGFKEGDVERACTAISNYDFAEFFARHVYGTVDPPLAEYFAYAGIDYSEDVIPCSFPFSLRGTRIVGRRTSAESKGPKPGEAIIKIVGQEILDPNAILRLHKPGDTLTLTLAEGDTQREVEVTLIDKPKVTATLKVNPNATEKQNRIRHAWLNSVD
jgi:predicted metalloprotease with PDZ domain